MLKEDFTSTDSKTSLSAEQLHLVSIQQEAGESVVVAVVIAHGTSFGQVDSHLVPGLQFHGHGNGAAVFKVLAAVFEELRHHFAVNLQIGTGGQVAPRGPNGVDGDGEAVHAGAGSGEDTALHIVAVSQVAEDMFVDDERVFSEGARAGQTFFAIVKGNREGTAVGWECTEEETDQFCLFETLR